MVSVMFKKEELNVVKVLIKDVPLSDTFLMGSFKESFKILENENEIEKYNMISLTRDHIDILNTLLNEYLRNDYVLDSHFSTLKSKLIEIKLDIKNNRMGW